MVKNMSQYPDEEDYQKEMSHPYKWKCAIHGEGYGPIDECPKCMEKDMEDQAAHEFDWVGPICSNCRFCNMNDHICEYYGFWTPRMDHKKKCKRMQLPLPINEDEVYYREGDY